MHIISVFQYLLIILFFVANMGFYAQVQRMNLRNQDRDVHVFQQGTHRVVVDHNNSRIRHYETNDVQQGFSNSRQFRVNGNVSPLLVVAPSGMRDIKILPAEIQVPLPENLQQAQMEQMNPASQDPTVLFDLKKLALSCSFDKKNHDYKINENIIFTFSITSKEKNLPNISLFLEWKRTGDDAKIGEGRNEISVSRPFSISTSLDRPGFIHLEGTLKDASGKILSKFNGGVGVALEDIHESAKEPSDFDEYWKNQLIELDDIPLFAQVTKVSKENAAVDVYAVIIPCTGPHPATGYLSIPAKAKTNSLPAELHLQAYGMRIPTIPQNPPDDKIYFDLNAHGLNLGESKQYYDNFSRSIGHYAYDIKQNQNRDTTYFKYMVHRVVQTCRYIKTIPQWNQHDFCVWGYSQGGLQTLWAAALVPGITLAKAGMPWSCNLGGAPLSGRLIGTAPQYTDALNYYDPVFFAKRIPESCMVDFLRTGLGDYVSPPSSVTAVYNNVKGPKKITYYQGIGHEEPKIDSKAYTIDATQKTIQK